MASNAELRRDFPEFIRNSSIPLCDFSGAVRVRFLAGGPYTAGYITLRVHQAARQAFRALAAVMVWWGYEFREGAGGTLSCRRITGGSATTLHAHGIAGDWNPSKNGYTYFVGPIQWGRQTDMPIAMVRAIEAIRTISGAAVWEWGGRWSNTKDPMHFQLDCRRSSLVSGINLATLPAGAWKRYLEFEGGGPLPPAQEDSVIPVDPSVIRPLVMDLQRALNKAATENSWPPLPYMPLQIDGRAGAGTKQAADKWRYDAGLQAQAAEVAFDAASIGALLALYA